MFPETPEELLTGPEWLATSRFTFPPTGEPAMVCELSEPALLAVRSVECLVSSATAGLVAVTEEALPWSAW